MFVSAACVVYGSLFVSPMYDILCLCIFVLANEHYILCMVLRLNNNCWVPKKEKKYKLRHSVKEEIWDKNSNSLLIEGFARNFLSKEKFSFLVLTFVTKTLVAKKTVILSSIKFMKSWNILKSNNSNNMCSWDHGLRISNRQKALRWPQNVHSKLAKTYISIKTSTFG